jgi:hypothetical protein
MSRNQPETKKKKFKIYTSWCMAATVEVEADDLNAAIDKAAELPLPMDDADYSDGSWEVYRDLCEEIDA